MLLDSENLEEEFINRENPLCFMFSDEHVPRKKTLIERLQEEKLERGQIIEFKLTETAFVANKGDKHFVKADEEYQRKDPFLSVIGRFDVFNFTYGAIKIQKASFRDDEEKMYKHLFIFPEAIKDYQVLEK